MIAGLVLMLVSCSSDALQGDVAPQKQEGMTNIRFNISLPAYSSVDTRANALYSQEGIASASDVQLLCFDKDGLFMGLAQDLTVAATNASDVKVDGSSESKTLSGKVADGTARIHVVANLPASDFTDAAEWVGLNETVLMSKLQTGLSNDTNNKMVYWGYVKQETAEKMTEYLSASSNNTIHLLRNRAKIEVTNNKSSEFTVLAYIPANEMEYGTVAPLNPTDQVYPTTDNLTASDWKEKCTYVTSPLNTTKAADANLSLVTDGTTCQYTYEHANISADPLKVIMKVKFSDNAVKYYKVLLQKDGEQLAVKRNHTYKITINALGKNVGYSTAEEAYNGNACNNPWITVDDIISEISDGTYTMNIVDGTYHLYTNSSDKAKTINFTYSGDDNMVASDFSVKWTSNKSFSNDAQPTLTYESGKGSVSFNIGEISEMDRRDAIIQLVDKKHGLTRNLHLFSKAEMNFDFTWGGTLGTAKDATASFTFTIPKDYPEELLPVEIRFASNDINPIADDCKVEVSSTSNVSSPDEWNCWFVKKYYEKSDLGKQQTITIKNVRAKNSGDTGVFWIYTKYTAGNTKDKNKEGYYKYKITYQ